MTLKSAFVCALAAVPLIAPLGLCAVPGPHQRFEHRDDMTLIWKSEPKEDDVCCGVIKKDQKLLILRYGANQADLQIYSSGKLLYTMPDITVYDQDDYVEADPGEAEPWNPYDFSLSPDHQYLFVMRELDSSETVGYLYKRSKAGRMVAVQPGGLRLDAAALHYFCRHYRKDESFLGQGVRNVEFVQWYLARNQIIFTVEAASYPRRHQPLGYTASAYWYTSYNLKTGHFKVYTHIADLPNPDAVLESGRMY